MKKIIDYDIVDRGIEGSQYFQGCGTSFTKFDACYTGCGSNPAEAIDDALEQIAMCGEHEIEGFEEQMKEDYPQYLTSDGDWSPTPYAHAECSEEDDECELYYYVSIRVKGE